MALALRGDPTLSGSARLGRLCFVAGKTQLFVGIIMVALPVGETAPGPHAALGPWHPEAQQPKALLVVQRAWVSEVFVRALAGFACPSALENESSQGIALPLKHIGIARQAWAKHLSVSHQSMTSPRIELRTLGLRAHHATTAALQGFNHDQKCAI